MPELEVSRLRRLCLEAGADDVGFVGIDRAEIAAEKPHVLAAFPRTRTLISLVCRMNRESLRSPMRSIGNLEFHRANQHLNEVAARIVSRLEREGVPALNPSAGFPMEMDRFPGRMWVVAHKPVAVAAGLGRIGLHHCVIHPKFGDFINLATVLVAARVDTEAVPIDFNPCLECKLCVAVCPVGAISPEGGFNFSACYTHNYREFMGGFADWAESLAEAGNARALRRRFADPEQASLWQSLAFSANYKAAYCIAVCPAGEDVIGPYLADKAAYRRGVLRPLQEKEEPVYVIAGSDAEASVRKRFPHKTVRPVRRSLRSRSIGGFLDSLSLVFQPGRAAGLDATYHFTFTGAEAAEATIRIRDRALHVERGREGIPDLAIRADSGTWLGIVNKERSVPLALLTRRLRIKGNPRLLSAFARCFP